MKKCASETSFHKKKMFQCCSAFSKSSTRQLLISQKLHRKFEFWKLCDSACFVHRCRQCTSHFKRQVCFKFSTKVLRNELSISQHKHKEGKSSFISASFTSFDFHIAQVRFYPSSMEVHIKWIEVKKTNLIRWLISFNSMHQLNGVSRDTNNNFNSVSLEKSEALNHKDPTLTDDWNLISHRLVFCFSWIFEN